MEDNDDQVDNMSMTSSLRDKQFGDMLGTDTATEATQRDIARMGVCERLYYLGAEKEKKKQEKLRHDRETKVMEELSLVTARPSITRRATKLPAKGNTFADQATMWQEAMETKRQNAIERVVDSQMQEATFSPSLNKKSLEMKRNYQGPVSAWDKQFAKFCAKKNVEAPQYEFRPNINESSRGASIAAPQDVVDRLYSESIKKRQDRMEESTQKELDRNTHDATTGQHYFTPKTNTTSSRNPSEVSQELFDQAEILAKKKEKLVKKFEDASIPSFAPELNARSATMMESTTRKPLYSPNRNRSPNPPMSEVSVASQASTKASAKPAKKADVEQFLLRNEKAKLQHSQRMTDLKREIAAKEKRECTFSPRVSAASERIFDQSSYSGKSPQRGATRAVTASADHMPPAYFSEPPPPYVASGIALPAAPTAPTPPTARMEHVAASQHGSGPTSRSASAANVEQYISNFEKEMFAVLDQWKKLEEV